MSGLVDSIKFANWLDSSLSIEVGFQMTQRQFQMGGPAPSSLSSKAFTESKSPVGNFMLRLLHSQEQTFFAIKVCLKALFNTLFLHSSSPLIGQTHVQGV